MSSVEVRTAIAIISTAHSAELAARVDEMEQQGQPVTLVCLERGAHDHGETLADVLHVPRMSLAIGASLVTRLARDPGRVLRTIARSRTTAASVIHLARMLAGRGISQVEGRDAHAARMAAAISQLLEGPKPDLDEVPVDWSQLSARRVGVRWFAQRINSIAAEVSVDGRRVIVKRQRSHAAGSAADRWAHEHRTLAALTAAMHDERFTVPRALIVDEQNATLVMERARGVALDALFATAASDRAAMPRLLDGVRGAGAWLAAMQAATRRASDGRALLDEVVRTAVRDVENLAPADPAIRRHARAIAGRINELHGRVAGHRLTVAGHHDDYWPGNIFFDGERVTVIDFESFRDGLPLEDVAYFLIRCELLQRRFRLPSAVLVESFFDGYSNGALPDADELQLFTLTKGLRTLGRGAGLDLPMPQRIWTRRTIRSAVLKAARVS